MLLDKCRKHVVSFLINGSHFCLEACYALRCMGLASCYHMTVQYHEVTFSFTVRSNPFLWYLLSKSKKDDKYYTRFAASYTWLQKPVDDITGLTSCKHNFSSITYFLESLFYFENLFWFNSPTSDSLTCCSKCLPVAEPGFPRSLLLLKGSSSFQPYQVLTQGDHVIVGVLSLVM